MSSSPPRQAPHRVSDFFALRTPLLPFTEYLEWAGDLAAPQALAAGATLEPALRADRQRLRARLRELIRRPEIREALYVASPSLDKSLAHWLQDPDSTRGLSAELVLVRYFQRMTHRCTPFGLFAGHSAGRFAANTRLALEPLRNNRRCTRLDRGWLSKLVSHLEQSHPLRESAIVHPNSSLYRAAGQLRYTEFRVDENGHRAYKLVAAAESPYLLEVLERADRGATVSQLAQALAAKTEATLEESAAFIHELIDAQMLVLDLELPITGPDATDELVARLECSPETIECGIIIRDAMTRMREMDRAGIGQAPACYENIVRALEDLPVQAGPSSVWQVDLFKPASEFVLGRNVAAEIEECAALVRRITPLPPTDSLSTFRAAFQRRYGERWVPLMEALDPETGIGFPVGAAAEADDVTLLAGFVASGSADAREPAWSDRDVFLLRHLEKLLSEGKREWYLTEADLQALDAEVGADALPDSCDIAVRLAASSAEAIERGDFKLLFGGCFGPPGGRLLGRFCYGDTELQEKTREHLRQEEERRPDALFAELVHLPQGRSGNLLARPVLRGHEIVFLGRSGIEAERQIKASDLVISVVDDHVSLYSTTHGKQVLPRLTSALSYSGTLGVSKFFGALAEQHTRNWLGWSWGRLEGERFLPRIAFGRIVLARATWNVAGDELKPIIQASDAERFRQLQAWRRERALPRFCLLIEGENELLVDLDNTLSIDTFCDLVKTRHRFTLEECFPGADELAVQGPEGRFTHDLVVPLLRDRSGPPPAPAPVSRRHDESIRIAENLTPGSEWLYFKLYGGEGTADHVLTEAVAPAIAELKQRGVIDSWFFIRYADPDPHLRLRLHGEATRLNAEALTEMHGRLAPMMKSGQLWRIELSTYEREIHRYGGPLNIERAERLFELDSGAALEIVRACQGDEGATFRWQLALAGADRWLRDFGLDLDARRAFARRARDGYVKEFNAQNKATQGWFAERFRKERKAIEPLIAADYGPGAPILAAGLQALQWRSQRSAPLIDVMRELQLQKHLSASLEDIAHSVIHMFLNRVLRSSQRLQELVIYEFLARLYDSEWARRKDSALRTVRG
jgi:lantibiotic biosynthesis protein